MGLFDLASPALQACDTLLAAFLPAVARVALWGVLGAALGMWFYVLISPQQALARSKKQLSEAQTRLAGHEGEFAELWQLVGLNLRLAVGRLGLTLGPAVGASIPIIFLLVWLSNAYGYQQPNPGDTVVVTAAGKIEDAAGLRWVPAAAIATEADAVRWQVRWPASGTRVVLLRDEQELLSLPTPNPSPIVHHRQWWNLLIANPAGYLPDDAGVEALEIAIPGQRILHFGPDWARGWPATFFLSLILVSVAIKGGFRVH